MRFPQGAAVGERRGEDRRLQRSDRHKPLPHRQQRGIVTVPAVPVKFVLQLARRHDPDVFVQFDAGGSAEPRRTQRPEQRRLADAQPHRVEVAVARPRQPVAEVGRAVTAAPPCRTADRRIAHRSSPGAIHLLRRIHARGDKRHRDQRLQDRPGGVTALKRPIQQRMCRIVVQTLKVIPAQHRRKTAEIETRSRRRRQDVAGIGIEQHQRAAPAAEQSLADALGAAVDGQYDVVSVFRLQILHHAPADVAQMIHLIQLIPGHSAQSGFFRSGNVVAARLDADAPHRIRDIVKKVAAIRRLTRTFQARESDQMRSETTQWITARRTGFHIDPAQLPGTFQRDRQFPFVEIREYHQRQTGRIIQMPLDQTAVQRIGTPQRRGDPMGYFQHAGDAFDPPSEAHFLGVEHQIENRTVLRRRHQIRGEYPPPPRRHPHPADRLPRHRHPMGFTRLHLHHIEHPQQHHHRRQHQQCQFRHAQAGHGQPAGQPLLSVPLHFPRPATFAASTRRRRERATTDLLPLTLSGGKNPGSPR